MSKFGVAVITGFLLVTYIQAGPIPDEFKEVAPTVHEVCVKETGVNEDLIKQASDGNITDDPKLKCYMKCVYDQFRLVSKNGMNFDIFLKLAPPSYKDQAEKVVKECSGTKATVEGDLCDLIFEINKCFLKVAPEEYFLM